MRSWRSFSGWSLVLLLSGAAVSCTKEPNPVPRAEPAGSGSAQRPQVAPSSGTDGKLEFVWDYTEPLCPRDKGPRKTAARPIGSWIRILPQEAGYAIQRRKPERGTKPGQHLLHVFDEAGNKIETIPGEKDPGSVISFDGAAWYSAPCKEGTCDDRGYGHELLRIDRATGKSEKLFGPEHAFVHGQPFGKYFYWASSGINDATGALRRVPRDGKKVETLWEGLGVASLLFSQDVALLADKHSVFEIPLGGGKPKQLVKDLTDARGLAVEGSEVFVVDRGDKLGKHTGRVLVVDRETGTSNVLATGLQTPTVVAVDGDRLYVMGEGHGNVLAIPRKGGTPTLFIPAPSQDYSCHTTRWIRSDLRGLRWSRMLDADKRGAIFFIPRVHLVDPIKQWRELLARGSSSEELKDNVDETSAP